MVKLKQAVTNVKTAVLIFKNNIQNVFNQLHEAIRNEGTKQKYNLHGIL